MKLEIQTHNELNTLKFKDSKNGKHKNRFKIKMEILLTQNFPVPTDTIYYGHDVLNNKYSKNKMPPTITIH